MEKGNDEKNKKARMWTEIIENYMENGLDNLGVERKFNLIMKFGPKKMPARAISRASINPVYSWVHYAP
jgi:hypothetical protein